MNNGDDDRTMKDEDLLQEPMTHLECWDILKEKCCRNDPQNKTTELPSFLTFNLFCRFMRHQFERTMNFALLQPKLSRAMGLSQLRHYFCDMLVSTSSDFSLRQVPRFKSLDEITYTLQENAIV